MPGRKSNGTETRGQFSAGLSFQFVTPCPGHLAGDFLLIEDCGGWIEGGSAAQPNPGLTPTKTGSHSQRCNSLFVLEPISGLEPETY